MILQIFLVNSLQYYCELGKHSTQFQPGHIAVFLEQLDLAAKMIYILFFAIALVETVTPHNTTPE